MNCWEKYREFLWSGEWHIHTSLADGKNLPIEYARAAAENQIPLIAFTEHVRKKMSYNYEMFCDLIKESKELFPQIVILRGIEAKILPDGTLDCPENIFSAADFKIASFHSFEGSIDKQIEAASLVFERFPVDCWGHPAFKRNEDILDTEYSELEELFGIMKNNHVLMEANLKHLRPVTEWFEKYSRVSNRLGAVYGSDSHSVEEMLISNNIKKGITKGEGGNSEQEIWLNSVKRYFYQM